MNSAGWRSEGVAPGDPGSGDLRPGDPGAPGLGADELALRTLASGDLPSAPLADRALAAGVAAGLERLIGLFRWLSPPSGLGLTAAATLATLDRGGPRRLTALAAREGVTQPAMTQLVARLQDTGLVDRVPDPTDGRVVQVRITAEGQAMVARRRAVRAERVAGLLARLSPDDQAALAAALPAMDALANAQRDEPLVAQA
jgi:DNA-binding MarR family transcriptional regulator